VIEEEHR
jgi:hypothetical protein